MNTLVIIIPFDWDAQLGDVMRGESVGVVEQSLNSRFKEGDLVAGASAGWCTYKCL